MLQKLLKELRKLVHTANMYGIPLPMVRDPKTEIGSVSLTLVFISSVMVILGLVGKWSGRLGVVDINNALEFFYASSFLYFGRNWRTGASSTDLEEGESSKNKLDDPPSK
jgi:hypothetical protein